jgi:hypoxanthine phosphoribosyltransferase
MVEEVLIKNILDQIKEDQEEFDLILCVGRGGLVMTAYIAHALNISSISFLQNKEQVAPEIFRTLGLNNKALIVDDISDTGDTMLNLVSNVTIPYKTAVLFERVTTSFRCDYVGQAISHNHEWVDFSWEKEIC